MFEQKENIIYIWPNKKQCDVRNKMLHNFTTTPLTKAQKY